MTLSSFVRAVALIVIVARTASAQAEQVAANAPADSGSLWAVTSLGYASPGVATSVQGWLAYDRFAAGAHYSRAETGGWDAAVRSSELMSFLAGVRVPAGPLRLLASVGGAFVNANEQTAPADARRLVWDVSAILPITRHVGLQGERYSTIGSGRRYVLDTIGIAIGSLP